MATTDELLDALIRNCKRPEDLIGEKGLLKQLYNQSLKVVIPADMTKIWVHRKKGDEKPSDVAFIKIRTLLSRLSLTVNTLIETKRR